MKRLFLFVCICPLVAMQEEAVSLSEAITTQPLVQAVIEPLEQEIVEHHTCMSRVRENPVDACSIVLLGGGFITGTVGTGFACAGLACAETVIATGCGVGGLGVLVGCGWKIYQRITRQGEV